MKSTILSLLALLAISTTSYAGMIGSSVHGQICFGGYNAGCINYFDPANGWVPGGYLNSAGSTVIIAEPATEFGFADGANTDSANFTDTLLTVGDQMVSGGSSWTMVFTSSAFTGASITKISDNFVGEGLSFSLTGDTLTIDWGGGDGAALQGATFEFGSEAPEPAVFGTAGLALAGLVTVQKMRRRKA